MNRIKLCFVLCILLCLLCSCAKGETDFNIELSPKDKSVYELSTKIYNDTELNTISLFTGTINELNEKYPVECIRKLSTGYRISYCGETNITSIFFDDLGNETMGMVYKVSKSKECFDTLSKGKSLDDVMKIDPNGEYLFLYRSWVGTPRISTHYTEDGYLITIEFDDKNMILNINEELI